MNTIQALIQQTESAHAWANRLIKGIPEDKWVESPDVLNSNMTWHIGHLIVSSHYHGIMSTIGLQSHIMERIPLRDYVKTFGFKGNPLEAPGKFPIEELLDNLAFIQEESIKAISSLTDEDLDTPIVPSKQPHPVAKTKFEVITWNIQHVMWHCGQIATMKRVLTGKANFGV
jgi:hypothetical protein